ncbi:MAG: dihydrodipicolinate synthase family protein [Opitutus sp.]
MKFALPQRDQVWSASPTPFLTNGDVDVRSVQRMIAHHVDLGVSGIMLAGTCGEGPWLRDRDRETLVRSAVEAAKGKLLLALQVTDNSAVRVLDNIDQAAAWGVELAVVAAPSFFLNATPERIFQHYRAIARRTALPLGLYDRGAGSPYVVREADLTELLAEPNIVVVKDSAQQPSRRKAYLAARDHRPELILFSGSEFDCVEYLEAGYDGLLLGGGIFNAILARKLTAAVRANDLKTANQLQDRMNDLMYRVYGGKKIECWMTGLKELLVQLGVFSTNVNLLEYPLTALCQQQIHDAVSGNDALNYRDDLLVKRRSFSPLAV